MNWKRLFFAALALAVILGCTTGIYYRKLKRQKFSVIIVTYENRDPSYLILESSEVEKEEKHYIDYAEKNHIAPPVMDTEEIKEGYIMHLNIEIPIVPQ